MNTPPYYELIETGFNFLKPEESGLYLMGCGESDYESAHVAIYKHSDGKLWVHDPNNGAATRWPLDLYHGNLTNPVWKLLP